MSLPNLTNNIMQQPQNIVINQVQPISHNIMPPNNGMPMHSGMSNQVQHQHMQIDQHQQHQANDMKSGIMMDTSPMPGVSLVNVQAPVQPAPVQAALPTISLQQNSSPVKSMHMSNANSSSSNIPTSTDNLQVLSKTRLADLIRDIDPNIYLEEDVEEILLGYVDDFVDRVINGASMIAKHRHVKNIEVKDVQMFINRNYNMWAPGLGTDELRPYKRSLTTESHKQRLALIRKALKKY
ncbi:transcription initiation factor TFIID subunit 12 [Atheta coriaria]|uniref:transcription initiation factor TFIID subunit 12 n=1 Tax=Dalotia coriaria TaxID=877792 RepID=UPI0031F39E00